MVSLITEQVVDCIYRAKSKMPAGWRIQTWESYYYLVLHIPMKEFNKLGITDKIRIAEATNQLCEDIKETGIPCYIEKI